MSARTKRPARSDSVCEHRDSRAGGARLMVKKSDHQGWTARHHAASMAAGERASHRVVHCGQRPHTCAHLQALRALLVLTAACACRLHSTDRRHGVHHDAAEEVVLLERREEQKIRLPALRHAARAHMHWWARPEPWDGLCGTGLASQRVPHSAVPVFGKKDGHVGSPGGATVGGGRQHRKCAQRRHGGRVRSQWGQRSSQPWIGSKWGVVSRFRWA